MEISMEYIVEKLNEKNNLFYDVLILRMYDEYKKIGTINNDFFDDEFKSNPLKIYNAYNNINIQFQKYKKNSYFSKGVTKEIEKQLIMLSSCIQSFQTNNKTLVQTTIDLVTNLECILNLPVTFPSKIESCLFRQLDLEQTERKKEIKRSRIL